MKIRAIVTGATGMVGEGVLHECLLSSDVEQVLVINRKPCGVSHPKLKEIIHQDFFNLNPIAEQLKGYNACYFCLGASSVGMNQHDYTRVTYDLTLHVAKTLLQQNNNMTFIYVSGSGTDSTEKGSLMWARVKGKTENDILNLGFKDAYAFRPGFMKPTAGQKNALSFYKYINWLYPALRFLAPGVVSTLSEVGEAMIKATTVGSAKKIMEVKDIVAIAKS
jgi:uncharacterized protein YbjT (DUF2867 family)